MISAPSNAPEGRAAAAAEACPAHHCGGDHVQLVALAGIRRGRAVVAEHDHGGNAGRQAAEGIDLHLDALDGQPAEAGGLLVAADGENVPARPTVYLR